MLFRSIINRNGHVKSTACADGALYPDFAMVFVDKFFTENQSEAGASLAGGTCGGVCFGEVK